MHGWEAGREIERESTGSEMTVRDFYHFIFLPISLLALCESLAAPFGDVAIDLLSGCHVHLLGTSSSSLEDALLPLRGRHFELMMASIFVEIWA